MTLHPSLAAVVTKPSQRSALEKAVTSPATLSFPLLNLGGLPDVDLFSHLSSPPSNSALNADLGAVTHTENEATFVSALLVGQLRPDVHGVRLLSHNRGKLVVIAPPPPASLANRLVFVRQWTYLRRGYFELLLHDIYILDEPEPLSRPRPVTSSVAQPGALVSVSGVIVAKTCVLSNSFLLELNHAAVAVAVVFQKKARHWWPFLHVKHHVKLHNLEYARLPSCGGRAVLLASDGFAAESSEHSITVTPTFAPQALSNKLQTLTKLSTIEQSKVESTLPKLCTTQHSDTLCTYSGVITSILPDHRYVLDDSLTFHLGPYYSSSSHSRVERSLRPETQILLHNVQPLYRHDGATIFPTARTSVDVLYFGPFGHLAPESTPKLSWRHTQWARIWRQWQPSDILWADELYDALYNKFSSTLSLRSHKERIACLLGTKQVIGLVQYIMHLQSKRDYYLEINATRRNYFDDFLKPTPKIALPSLPCVPTISQLKECIYQASQARPSQCNPPAAKSGHVLSSSELRMRMRSASVLAVLDGTTDCTDQLILSDDTAQIRARCIGCLPLLFFGAIVLLETFSITIDTMQKHGGLCILFDHENLQVVVDGPYADHKNDESGSICESVFRTPSMGGALSQYTQANIPDVPLLALFVSGKYLRPDRTVLEGHLLGFRKRTEDFWEVVLDENKELVPVSFYMRGENGQKASASIVSGRVFGVSCTEFANTNDIPLLLCEKRKVQEEVVLGTFCKTMLPFIVNLGSGASMRFVASGRQSLSSNNFACTIDEGLVYDHVRAKVQVLQERLSQRLSKTLSLFNGNKTTTILVKEVIIENKYAYIDFVDVELEMHHLCIRVRSDLVSGLAGNMVVVLDGIRENRALDDLCCYDDASLRILKLKQAGKFGSCGCMLKSAPLAKVIRFAPWRTLSSFSKGGVGTVLFTICRIEVIRISIATFSGCEQCCEDNVTLQLEVEAKVEDGTRQISLNAHGLKTVSRILRLDAQDLAGLRQLVKLNDHYDLHFKRSSAYGLQRLFQQSYRPVVGVVVGRGWSSEIADVEVRCMNMGFGKYLWTAFDARDNIVVDCISVVHSGDDEITWAMMDNLAL